MAWGQGNTGFSGRVRVCQEASHSEAHQHNRNLLLAKTAEVHARPELMIDIDEVVCSHGVTVGDLDDEALFYLQSRAFQS